MSEWLAKGMNLHGASAPEQSFECYTIVICKMAERKQIAESGVYKAPVDLWSVRRVEAMGHPADLLVRGMTGRQPAAVRPVIAPGVRLCTIRFTMRRGMPTNGTTKRSKNHHTGLMLIHGRIQPPDTCLAYSAIAIAKTRKIATLTQLMRKPSSTSTHRGYIEVTQLAANQVSSPSTGGGRSVRVTPYGR